MGGLRTRLLAAAVLAVGSNGPAVALDKIVVAHRGASGYLPEHTLEAKAYAYATGAHYIEQDLVLTADGVPIVLHDIHLDTVTDVADRFPDRAREDGRFFAIDFTLEEIKQLEVTERFDLETGEAVYPRRFPLGIASFEIPTLAEEIELVQGLNSSTGRRVGIYPEIKAPAFHRDEGQDISRIVLDVLREHGYTDKDDAIFLQCFDWNETQRIRGELGYEGRLVQLIAENEWNESPEVDFEQLRTREGLEAVAAVADGIGPWMPHVVTGIDANGDPEITDLVQNAQELGLAVHPYTFRADSLPDYAGSLEEAMRIFYFDAGVEGIFTDFPDRAVDYLRRVEFYQLSGRL